MEDSNNLGLLNSINYPKDLRKLSVEQLPEVCSELRQDIIKELSVNPGHLASSLGVVEITVALHYVFNTPYDRIVWDVGHQAYGHKILTGRREQFCTNRKLHGLRPFPSPEESEYDSFVCGHASNSISAALGMAVAAKKLGEKRQVVAVIGDGAMSGGLAFEGLNNASSTPNDMLIILNDNNMSIDRSVGGMKQYLLGLNTNETYNALEPAKGGNDFEIIGKEQICSHYGICSPEQVIDILTIWGASSDNVPGVRGIGEIGAKKLMEKYGNIENILKHLDELPARQKEGFEEFKEQLSMSRFLVTIKTDIPLPSKLEEIKVKSPDMHKVSEIFDKYEFNSLKKNLREHYAASNIYDKFATNETTPQIFSSFLVQIKESQFDELYKAAQECGELAIVQDERGFILATNTICSKSNDYCTPEKSGYNNQNSFLFCHTGEDNRLYSNLFQDKKIKKIGYDLKSIIKLLANDNIELAGELRDIELMHYLINPERTHKENFLIKQYLSIDLDSDMGSGPAIVPDLFSSQLQERDLNKQSDTALQEKYKRRQSLECALLIPLGDKIAAELIKNGQDKLYMEMEMPLIEVLADMEREGFKIDTEQLKN